MQLQSIRKIILMLSAVLLNGCLSPLPNNHQCDYVLNAINPNCLHAPCRNVTLLVTKPKAEPIYNTTQMAYSTCPFTVSYYSKNYWADTPPNMLQALMVQSLQNTCHYHAVVPQPYSGKVDLKLNTQLVVLKQDFSYCPSRSRVVLRAQLVNASSGKVIAACQFDRCFIAPQANPYGGVIAANAAVAQILGDLAAFCLRVS